MIDLDGTALRATWRDVELFRYVFRPRHPQVESPRPYLHPIRTLGGRLVSVYRPHDHVWHKGLSLALPNLGPHNFWGGPTYLRSEGGYAQLPNNGTQRHESFDVLSADRFVERLRWLAQDGTPVLDERREWTVSGLDSAWRLDTESVLVNTGPDLEIGNPETEGRAGAAYGGLFWRGPRSFTGGTIRIPGVLGADDLNGARAPWMAFAGHHDGDGGTSTVLMAADSPVSWFARSAAYAVLCPALDAPCSLPSGATLRLRYAFIVADGELDDDTCTTLARFS